MLIVWPAGLMKQMAVPSSMQPWGASCRSFPRLITTVCSKYVQNCCPAGFDYYSIIQSGGVPGANHSVRVLSELSQPGVLDHGWRVNRWQCGYHQEICTPAG